MSLLISKASILKKWKAISNTARIKCCACSDLSEIYPEFTDNPMKWIRAYVDSFDDTKTDFFEQTSRQYVKTSDLNGFDDL